MKNWQKIGIVILLIASYIFLINIFANLISISQDNYEISETETIISGNIVQIGVGQSVNVQVTRNRWYGTIYETDGKAYLYLFRLIKLPHKIKNYNFIWFHLIFLIILILFSILIFTKRKVYKEENPYLEHEKLGENYINFN